MIAIVGSAFDASSFYETVARLAGAVAVWASLRAQKGQPSPDQAYEDLKLRLRHPWQYRVSRVTRLFR